MIYEFALDPASINNWQRFRFFYDQFGFSHGRLISEFPKKWKKMVYEVSAACSEIERKRIEVRLKAIDEKLCRQPRAYDGTKDWLANAEEQHQQDPFHAIIAISNPRNNPDVIVSDDVSNETPLWRVERERRVNRTPLDLARTVESLFEKSTEILLVDPHFGPEMSRYRRTLTAFLQVAKSKAANIVRIEIHLESRSTAEFFAETCQRELPRIIPRGLIVKLVRWQQLISGDHLHPRYILTEVGGIRIESGLDEGSAGETTDVSLLDEQLHSVRWRQYQRDTCEFEFVDEISITGSA